MSALLWPLIVTNSNIQPSNCLWFWLVASAEIYLFDDRSSGGLYPNLGSVIRKQRLDDSGKRKIRKKDSSSVCINLVHLVDKYRYRHKIKLNLSSINETRMATLYRRKFDWKMYEATSGKGMLPPLQNLVSKGVESDLDERTTVLKLTVLMEARESVDPYLPYLSCPQLRLECRAIIPVQDWGFPLSCLNAEKFFQ